MILFPPTVQRNLSSQPWQGLPTNGGSCRCSWTAWPISVGDYFLWAQLPWPRTAWHQQPKWCSLPKKNVASLRDLWLRILLLPAYLGYPTNLLHPSEKVTSVNVGFSGFGYTFSESDRTIGTHSDSKLNFQKPRSAFQEVWSPPDDGLVALRRER